MCGRMNGQARTERRGFTLIELLVVVSIIALLISILLPSLSRARAQAKTTVCLSGLHQLGIAVVNYTDEYRGRLPYYRGTVRPPDNQPTHAPYYQYHQIFNFWDYLKDLKIYQCPSAADDNSVKNYTPNDPRYSYYTVFKSDDRYLNAFRNGWWPEINPTDFTGPTIDPLYTEYWSNDWSTGATDFAGRPIPPVNGGGLDKLPFPNSVVIMSDAVWETKNYRHQGGTNMVFIDGHAARYAGKKYLDHSARTEGRVPLDLDAYNCRPFYCWGLTRDGVDGDLP